MFAALSETGSGHVKVIAEVKRRSPSKGWLHEGLDVTQIARWAGCLGGETTVQPIEGARHDVFLSQAQPRERAYTVLNAWLDHLHLPGTAAPEESTVQHGAGL